MSDWAVFLLVFAPIYQISYIDLPFSWLKTHNSAKARLHTGHCMNYYWNGISEKVHYSVNNSINPIYLVIGSGCCCCCWCDGVGVEDNILTAN